MPALRTTIPSQRRSIRFLLRMAVFFLIVSGIYGCGSAIPADSDASSIGAAPAIKGANDPSWLTSREKLPPPDTDRIEFDREKRMLILYDLPGRDNWMVQLPDEEVGRLVGPQYRLPDGIDMKRTLVFYSRAGMKISASVTVAQIEAGRLSHSSLAIGQ